MYKKGIERRNRLISAAVELLGSEEVEKITLSRIAAEAGIPSASAYHFFSNANDVFQAAARRFGHELLASICDDYSDEHLGTWQDLFSAGIDRGVELYRATPAYRQLILGAGTPPAVKVSDLESDAKIGFAFAQVLKRYFVLPKVPRLSERVFYAVEIVDMFFTLSFIYSGRITDEAVAEAKVAAVAYLERYLGCGAPRR